MSRSSAITVTGLTEIQRSLSALPRLIVAKGMLKGADGFNAVVEAALAAVTPVQQGDGGYYKDPGSLREALGSYVEIDGNGQGVASGTGYGEQAFIARLVDQGHQVIRNGRVVGAASPHPFIRQVIDGPALPEAVAEFIEIVDEELPGIINNA